MPRRQVRAGGLGQEFHQLAVVGGAEFLGRAVEMGSGFGGATLEKCEPARSVGGMACEAPGAEFARECGGIGGDARRVGMPQQLLVQKQVPGIGHDAELVAQVPLHSV